ncbi:hypothetical protein L1987_69075 [Smallanthus sonchifolius]|uniref:Uncharacterized protein n=1 Tax=Smallanthus sonchifolius TaxID=185202 RepID=A0ACB9B4K9_9ASTR|nr:hypothetical protein L1987_69075 [Smallanthus sonchifolius]
MEAERKMKKRMSSHIFQNPVHPSLVFNGLTVAVDRYRLSCGINASSSNSLIEIASHLDLRMKQVVVGEDTDLVSVQNQHKDFRRKSMWCRNVCKFHEVIKVDGCLGLIMDKCNGYVETEMQQNEGRLTLEDEEGEG